MRSAAWGHAVRHRCRYWKWSSCLSFGGRKICSWVGTTAMMMTVTMGMMVTVTMTMTTTITTTTTAARTGTRCGNVRSGRQSAVCGVRSVVEVKWINRCGWKPYQGAVVNVNSFGRRTHGRNCRRFRRRFGGVFGFCPAFVGLRRRCTRGSLLLLLKAVPLFVAGGGRGGWWWLGVGGA